MPLKVRDAIGADTGERVVIRRRASGDYADGIWVEGTPELLKALASVQQPTKQQLELFTGLERGKDMRSFYVNRYVRTASEFNNEEADIILWNGREYKAMQLGDWDSYGYCIAVGVRIK